MVTDINCDMGESFGSFSVGQDELLFPHISSCNIACGFHAGDPWHIDRTIQLALASGVQVGAHPSFPDLQGFGRRPMHVAEQELRSIVRYQVAAVKGLVESLGGKLSHVKPHGALYTQMARDNDLSAGVLKAILSIDGNLAIVGLAGSATEEEANRMGVRFLSEAFIDRRYTSNGQLVPRNSPQAVLGRDEAVEQGKSLMLGRPIKTEGEGALHLQPSTLCIHGDHPQAVAIAQALSKFAAGLNDIAGKTVSPIPNKDG